MVALFSDLTRLDAWPWAGFTPAVSQAVDVAEARFSLISAAPFLAGHFPARPILPGVAIIDAAVMACRSAAGIARLRLSAIGAARFLCTVTPGDELAVRVTQTGELAWRATATACGVLCARMTLHLTETAHAPRVAVSAQHAGPEPAPQFDLGPAEIARRLPQRAPMLMLSGAMRMADGTWDVHGRPYLSDAGDGRHSAYPESLICEGFFQAAGIAIEASLPEGAMLLLGNVGRADFLAVPHATEAVRHIVTKCRMIGDAALVAGETRTLDGVPVARYADVLVVVRAADALAMRASPECV